MGLAAALPVAAPARAQSTAAGPAAPAQRPALAAAQPGTAQPAPPIGRYTCLRIGSMSNEIADDLRIEPRGRYSVAGASGAYAYDARTRILTWLTGAFETGKTEWVGVYVPAGGGGSGIEGAKHPTVLIRAKKDVAAGNKRDLQWCNLAP